ncbi:MAG: ATP-dependent helicase, partial [Pseudomonadota bacterium]|nr:ATP-dependent helicase [Pseudomonadota bacterium]
MSYNQLNAVVMPDGNIQLEWGTTPGKISQSGENLQNEIYEHYSNDLESWLFYLGFCNNKRALSLSPALQFWRRFSVLFVRKLKLTPNLEEFRNQVIIPLFDEEITRLLEQIPMMPGSEYLHAELFIELWETLHRSFSQIIAAYTGSVEEFFKELSPDVHLAGRIYFHLVENKTGDDPFAFLATYSTRLDEEGESRHLPLKYALEEYEDD